MVPKSISSSGHRIYNGLGVHSSPAVREYISVAISFDLLRKRRVMREDVSVSKVRQKIDEMVARRELLFVGHSRSLYGRRVVSVALSMSLERKK
jgi:hypothetical protein